MGFHLQNVDTTWNENLGNLVISGWSFVFNSKL